VPHLITLHHALFGDDFFEEQMKLRINVVAIAGHEEKAKGPGLLPGLRTHTSLEKRT
jgi:hypothetical protein